MKTWFDWMEEYYIPQPQQNGAQAGEVERILALTRQKLGLPACCAQQAGEENGAAQSVEKTQPPARRVRWLWALVAAAVLAVCLGAGTVAAGVFPWESVGDFFGKDSREQAAYLGMPGEGLGLTQTEAGVTVTLEGILDDGTTAYIPAQITFAEGQYDPTLRYHVGARLAPGKAVEDWTGSCGDQPLQDPDPTDNTIPVMLTASHKGLRPGDAVELTIIWIYGNSVLPDGSTKTDWEWEHEMCFSFTLPESQPPVTVSLPEGTVEPDTGTPITQVSLTPMRVEVVFGEHLQDSFVRDALSRVPLSLTFTDGTTLALPDGWEDGSGDRSAGGGQGGPDGGDSYYAVECVFGTFIDPAAIAAVSVNGVEIPLR